MNPALGQYFAKAKQLANRGQNYEKESNFGYASKCYSNCAVTLGHILRQTKNPETAQTLMKKISKYKDMAAEMLVKQKELESKSKNKSFLSKMGFGFPERSNNTIPPLASSIRDTRQQQKMNNSNRNSLPQPKNDESGLMAKNIKNSFDDIIGMKDVKQILYEAVIIPQKRPDLFEGIRSPPRGILLYGPPGNGKTFITKALAKQSGCVFYGVSAGSIVNKFVGESEKTLRKIFQTAKETAPSIIFIDQIDSILTARTESDSDSARRLKTQFLVQFDQLEGPVIVIGATNLPSQLDLAALRRFNKLVYVGLPDKQARIGIVEKTLKDIPYSLSKSQQSKLVSNMEGYSASEITDIIKEATMIPLRQIPMKMIETVSKNNIRPVKYEDFQAVIKKKKPLLSKQDLKKYQGKFM